MFRWSPVVRDRFAVLRWRGERWTDLGWDTFVPSRQWNASGQRWALEDFSSLKLDAPFAHTIRSPQVFAPMHDENIIIDPWIMRWVFDPRHHYSCKLVTWPQLGWIQVFPQVSEMAIQHLFSRIYIQRSKLFLTVKVASVWLTEG